MPVDYTKMWEAWVSGGEWDDPLTQGTPVREGRIQDFYSEVVGPAFQGGTDFGTVYQDYISDFDTYDLEAAERTFKLAIGDPYTYGEDPFAWERLSRMTPDQAQDHLNAELIGQGKRLGGEYGAEYGTSTAKELETYTTGLTGARESLTYEGLEGAQGLASGTGGSVLRSGGAQAVAEDTLIEAYKATQELGAGFKEGRAGIEIDLEENLNDALTTYLDSLTDEKEDWYNTILHDVRLAGTGDAKMYEFGVEELPPEWGDETYTKGLEYEEEFGAWADEACGIGYIRNADGVCVLEESLGLVSDEYGRLCDPKDRDECGVCDGDGSSCLDDCGVANGDNSSCTDECGVPYGDNSSCADECGVPNGDNSSCADCAGTPNGDAVEDECGVCGGSNQKILCQDGETMACDYDECPEVEQPSTYCDPNDPNGFCDPAGETVCYDGYEYDLTAGKCVEIFAPPGAEEEEYAYDVWCPNGEQVIGTYPGDTRDCPHGDEIQCADGSLPSENPHNECPETQTDDCRCITQRYRCKALKGEAGWCTQGVWDCPGQPKDGTLCGGGPSKGELPKAGPSRGG